MAKTLAQIVVPASGEAATRVNGTRVVLPSGDYLPGVYKIVLTADVGDVWRAAIHCYVRPPEVISAEADFVQAPGQTNDPNIEDITSLNDVAVQSRLTARGKLRGAVANLLGIDAEAIPESEMDRIVGAVTGVAPA